MQILTTEQLQQLHPESWASIGKRERDEQRRAEWMEARRGRLTASQIYKLFSSKYQPSQSKTAYGYIYEKVAESFGAYPEPFSSRPTDRGKELEAEAIQAYMNRTGYVVTHSGEDETFIPYGKISGATPDGRIDDLFGLVQTKCPYNPGIHARYLTISDPGTFKDELPEYYCQMQLEMLAADAQWNDFASYDPRFPDPFNLHLIRILRDDEFIEQLQQVLTWAEQEMNQIIKQIRNK